MLSVFTLAQAHHVHHLNGYWLPSSWNAEQRPGMGTRNRFAGGDEVTA
jgi:hypothetical protein